MTRQKHVQMLYDLGNARWYDLFRELWMNAVSKQAEREFTTILRKKITSRSTILDLGCGTGINVGRIRDLKFKQYVGLDLSSSMLNVAREKYGNIQNVSFARRDITTSDSKKYDLIISTWVLSHLEKPATIINRHYEHLSKKGTMLLIFLTSPPWYVTFWFYPLVRLFAAKPVADTEIDKMKGRKTVKRYALGMTTFVEVRK